MLLHSCYTCKNIAFAKAVRVFDENLSQVVSSKKTGPAGGLKA